MKNTKVKLSEAKEFLSDYCDNDDVREHIRTYGFQHAIDDVNTITGRFDDDMPRLLGWDFMLENIDSVSKLDDIEIFFKKDKNVFVDAFRNHGSDKILEYIELPGFYQYADNIGIDYAVETYEESYQGFFPRGLSELAEHLVATGSYGDVPDTIMKYIDYDSIADDSCHEYTDFGGHIFLNV